eukprot:1708918-Prymnesium_polylepis.1
MKQPHLLQVRSHPASSSTSSMGVVARIKARRAAAVIPPPWGVVTRRIHVTVRMIFQVGRVPVKGRVRVDGGLSESTRTVQQVVASREHLQVHERVVRGLQLADLDAVDL